MDGTHMNEKEENVSIDEPSEIDVQLRGNTLIVYWYMVRSNRPLGAREIQRAVGLSSSSLALHHLNKLIELELVGKDEYGGYVITRRVNPGLLGFFVGTGRLLIPRFVLYAFFYTGLLVSCLLVFFTHLDAVVITLLVSLMVSTLIFWFETAKMWKSQPY
jgi:predicted DNA-binding transcriptional regulator